MNLALEFTDKVLPELLLPALLAVAVFLLVFLLARRRNPSEQLRLHTPPQSRPAARSGPVPVKSVQPNNAAPVQNATPRRNPPHRHSHDHDSSASGASAGSSGSSQNQLPCILLLGPENSGKSAILHGLKRSFSDRGRAWISDLAQGVARWQFTDALVLEVAGDLFLPHNNGNGNGNANGNGSSNGQAGSTGWKKLLDRLQQQRPRRPIDGVVLTVPSAELSGDKAISSEQWQRRAAQMSKNLRQARDQFGFCFPVYIVVTGCESVPGFQAFVDGQLQSSLHEILGWSNPYNLDAPFHPDWTSEAFTSVQRILAEQRAEYFAASQSGHDPHELHQHDDLFLFPRKFQGLQTPLAGFLERLFQDTGHRDALQFRGIYFSGHVDEGGACIDESSPRWDETHFAAFTTELFDQKIFPERGLARPVETSLKPRNRSIFTAKVLAISAALLLFSGMGLGYFSLTKTSARVLPHLAEIPQELRDQSHTGPKIEYASDAIYAAQGLSGSNFESLFLPASLIAPLHPLVERDMPAVFHQLVYPALNADLERRTRELILLPMPTSAPAAPARDTAVSAKSPAANPTDNTAPCSILPVASPAGAPATAVKAAESKQLEIFASKLIDLESNIVLFNQLAPDHQGSADELLRLVHNLNPPGITNLAGRSNSGLDAVVLGSFGDKFDGRPWNQQTSDRLKVLLERSLQQRLNEMRLVDCLDILALKINLLEAGKLQTYRQLDELFKLMGQVQKELDTPDAQWIAQNQELFQLPADLRQTLGRLFGRPSQDKVLLCDAEQAPDSCINLVTLQSSAADAAREHLAKLRAQLLAAQTETTGGLLAIADGKLQYSENTARLQHVLDNFLKLPFVAHQGEGELHEVQAGQQLFWDASHLQEALADKQAYDKFFADNLANTPPELQDTFENVALDRLAANMVDAVSLAQQPQNLPSGDQAEAATAAEVRAFQSASPLLNQILQQFSELNFEDDYQNLLSVTTSHALIMLARIDRGFDGRRLYQPPDGTPDQWTGEKPPSQSLYGKKNPDEMQTYLASQRQDTQQYVTAAQPLLAFLQQHTAHNRKPSVLATRWQAIVNDVQKYLAAPPGSGMGSLEDYLANVMDKTVPPECQASSAPAGTVYFLQVRRTLEHSLSQRCHFLAHLSALHGYQQFADFFNVHLAGRFPFAPRPVPYYFATSDPVLPSASEADPADIVELYRRLDSEGKSIRTGLQGAGSGETATQIANFLNQLEALRPVFASLLSADPGAPPAFDFVPLFRVNRGHEINGNQIIDWSLLAGNDAFYNSDPPHTGHWTYGQPLKLTLRWAKDSPERPLVNSNGYGDPTGRTLVFEFRDPWSLLHMLVQHAASPSDFDRAVDPDPQTLAFSASQQPIPPPEGADKKPVPPPSSLVPTEWTKVFVGIKLYAPGKTTSLRLPPFPAQAPVLPQVP